MRICFVTSVSLNPIQCGIGNYILNLSIKLIQSGHEVTVITRGDFSKTSMEELKGIKIYKLPFVPIYPFHVHFHGLFVRKFLQTHHSNFDIIHFHSPLPPAFKTNVPSILTFHSSMLKGAEVIDIEDLFSVATKFQAKLISYPLEKRLIQNVNAVTAVSNKVAEEFTKYGLKIDDIKIVPNGVDENIFLPAYKSKDYGKYVLYTGRISYGKGLKELIESAKYICNIRNDIDFILAGDGPLLTELQEDIVDNRLQERIRAIGRVDQNKIVELYRNATIFVFPSYYEGLPGSLLEAMSCELPIVATEVPGNVELITHDVNGILIPPKNSNALSSSILVLLDQTEKCERLGIKAREKVKKEFTWDSILSKIIDCYESVMMEG